MSRALLFDCDGVLAETERDGHLVAFNQMWLEFGVPWSWSAQEYGRKLVISGGRERMRSLYSEPAFRAAFQPPEDEDEWNALVLAWHTRKSEIYQEMITSGAIPPRSGVKRLAEEALASGWLLGVCSTSARESVRAVLLCAMGQVTANRFSLLLGGDSVAAKKPDPAVYHLALQRLAVSPEDCLVIEDSRNGLLAATGAGAKCLVTVSDYTRDEGFPEAALVVTCLGDPDGERCRVLANRTQADPGDCVRLSDLERIMMDWHGGM